MIAYTCSLSVCGVDSCTTRWSFGTLSGYLGLSMDATIARVVRSTTRATPVHEIVTSLISPYSPSGECVLCP